MSNAIPVTVIGGYLGSGKTTLVNHLLRQANGLRIAVLVNEFGELPIDEDLIEAQDDDIISIAGGCVCCSFGSDLTGALLDMTKLDPAPDHLLIESSGVAIPSAIVGSVSLLQGFRVDGIVTLADAETLHQSAHDKYMGDTVIRQVTDANIIVLNKTDLVDASALAKTKTWAQAQNGQAKIISCVQSIVPPQAVLESFLTHSKTNQRAHDTGNLEMATLHFDHRVDIDTLVQELTAETAGVIRAKGFVTALNGQKTLIQIVGNRCVTTPAQLDKTDGLVCLGFKGVFSKFHLERLGQIQG